MITTSKKSTHKDAPRPINTLDRQLTEQWHKTNLDRIATLDAMILAVGSRPAVFSLYARAK